MLDFDKFYDCLIDNPVIGAIRCDDDLECILKKDIKIAFILYGNLFILEDALNKLREKKIIVFVHIDMIEGLKSDQFGIIYLKKVINPDGIITTKPSNIKHIKNSEMLSILRIFAIDSKSLETGIKSILEYSPNAVEILPGSASKSIKNMQKSVKVPIIAGGLINTKEDVIECLSYGAIAISTTSHSVWDLLI
ncbi:MAG: glycerol-3-phosphate responsive antiterminator [Oscillospiraceae bacterium]|nr:glycerol-3-phosphate responsive antiterminator [Oscillospiraceae bacterium]